ncbi:hypothetical protein JHK85_000813 [Glycine max]|nr:hypothetical protein JHK85_000813 [Glycine max]
MENSWWEQELHPYNQYEEERHSNIENKQKTSRKRKIALRTQKQQNRKMKNPQTKL